jgi:hypothetical protein
LAFSAVWSIIQGGIGLLEVACADVLPAKNHKITLSEALAAGYRPLNGNQALLKTSGVTFWLRHQSVMLLNGSAIGEKNTRGLLSCHGIVHFYPFFWGVVVCGKEYFVLACKLQNRVCREESLSHR